jgi:hypothetical protein
LQPTWQNSLFCTASAAIVSRLPSGLAAAASWVPDGEAVVLVDLRMPRCDRPAAPMPAGFIRSARRMPA